MAKIAASKKKSTKKTDQPKTVSVAEESAGQKRKVRADEETDELESENNNKKNPGDLRSKLVWVYGIKPATSEKELRDFFENCGEIVRLDKADRHAYIEFRHKKDLKAALNKNGKSLGDLKLRVEVARESLKHAATNTIFFAGFDKELDVALIRSAIHEAFSKHGEIVGDIRIPFIHSKKALKKPKGIGYLQMASIEQASKAIKHLSGKEIAGGKLRLDFSEDLKAPESKKRRRGKKSDEGSEAS
ncbi:hypothetical protein BX666DRAFT_1921115 [Dichotomocladium elegans]|nr:hypothetical protein BX666DRAFT_1921115 [Dichotomocladium elegans]